MCHNFWTKVEKSRHSVLMSEMVLARHSRRKKNLTDLIHGMKVLSHILQFLVLQNTLSLKCMKLFHIGLISLLQVHSLCKNVNNSKFKCVDL